MIRDTWRSGAVLVALIVLVTGCNRGNAVGPVPVERAYSQLDAREDAHHLAATNATNVGALGVETARYAADMDSLIDAMMDWCVKMGAGGMMRDHDMSRMRNVADGMSDMIRWHHARMDSLSTIEAMRAECDEHHEDMGPMLDRMHEALPSGGMMGGGMMGDGWMGGGMM